MDIKFFIDKITQITNISREEIFKLIKKEQKKVIGTLHVKVALMRAVINLYHQSHDKELFDEITCYMTIFYEDICFSEDLDVHTVKWHICEPDDLDLNYFEFRTSNLELYECDCSIFSENRTCSHVEMYKKSSFDPWTIWDNCDHYLQYEDIKLEDISYITLITEFPRWVIEYLIQNWQEYYSINQIIDKLGVSYNAFNKLLDILHEHRKKLIKDLEEEIKERFLKPKEGKVWAGRFNLKELPSIPDNLPYIETLELGANNLTSLPNSLEKLTNLRELNIEANRFTEMPVLIGNLTTLEILKLNFNKIKRIPKFISNLKHLRVLELKRNYLTMLPDSFGNLSRLENLQISNNRLEILPDTFGSLEALKCVDLSSNNLVALPHTFYNLKSLEILDLSNNIGLNITKSINKLKSLRNLNLGSNGKIIFPTQVCSLENLEELSLTSNKLRSIPESIGNLTSLTRLNLSDNLIENYPKSICKLKNLEFLRLGCSSLSILPDFLLDFLIELEVNGADLGIAPIFFNELKQRRA